MGMFFYNENHPICGWIFMIPLTPPSIILKTIKPENETSSRVFCLNISFAVFNNIRYSYAGFAVAIGILRTRHRKIHFAIVK